MKTVVLCIFLCLVIAAGQHHNLRAKSLKEKLASVGAAKEATEATESSSAAADLIIPYCIRVYNDPPIVTADQTVSFSVQFNCLNIPANVDAMKADVRVSSGMSQAVMPYTVSNLKVTEWDVSSGKLVVSGEATGASDIPKQNERSRPNTVNLDLTFPDHKRTKMYLHILIRVWPRIADTDPVCFDRVFTAPTATAPGHSILVKAKFGCKNFLGHKIGKIAKDYHGSQDLSIKVIEQWVEDIPHGKTAPNGATQYLHFNINMTVPADDTVDADMIPLEMIINPHVQSAGGRKSGPPLCPVTLNVLFPLTTHLAVQAGQALSVVEDSDGHKGGEMLMLSSDMAKVKLHEEISNDDSGAMTSLGKGSAMLAVGVAVAGAVMAL